MGWAGCPLARSLRYGCLTRYIPGFRPWPGCASCLCVCHFDWTRTISLVKTDTQRNRSSQRNLGRDDKARIQPNYKSISNLYSPRQIYFQQPLVPPRHSELILKCPKTHTFTHHIVHLLTVGEIMPKALIPKRPHLPVEARAHTGSFINGRKNQRRT